MRLVSVMLVLLPQDGRCGQEVGAIWHVQCRIRDPSSMSCDLYMRAIAIVQLLHTYTYTDLHKYF